MAVYYLKNESGSEVTIIDLGISLPDDTSTTIDSNEIDGYYTPDLGTAITAGDLILSTTDIGTNTGDLTATDALAALTITSRYDRDNPHSVTITQAITADSNTDITTTELEELSDGSETALHIHDDRYYTEVELSTAGQATVDWDNIANAPTFGSPTWREPVEANLSGKGTSAEMNISGLPAGSYWWNTDDDYIYKYDGTNWVSQGATTGDRYIYKDGTGSDDYIYEFDGTTWNSTVPDDNWAVMVDDDGDGLPAQYIYNSDGTPPDWVKMSDINWGDHNSIGGRNAADAHPASSISYINTTSGLTATEVQAAIDEIDNTLDTISTSLNNHVGDTTNPHSVTFTQAVTADAATDILASEAETLTDGSNADLLHIHDALNVTYDNTTSSLTSTNVQDAINEVINVNGYGTTSDLYVDKNRTDTYVETGSIIYPFKTIPAAISAAVAGQTMRVGHGTYTDTFTLPNGVNLVFNYIHWWYHNWF